MFAVIFEVRPYPDRFDAYLGYAKLLRPELERIDGFLANERYASRRRAGWLVSLSLWRDEKALVRWRTRALHHEVQEKGRASVFADYHLRVGAVAAGDTCRSDITEVGAAKVVTLTERPLEGWAAEPAGTPRPLEWDLFESITRPGEGLLLQSWAEHAAAERALIGAPGRHRTVAIIRDYGMTDRREAPQYFPPAPTRPARD